MPRGRPPKPPEPTAPDRTCSTCGQTKPAGDFARTGYAGKGYQKKCRTCAKAKVPDPRTCRTCHQQKPADEFPLFGRGRYGACYTCLQLPNRPPRLSPMALMALRGQRKPGKPKPPRQPDIRVVPVDADGDPIYPDATPEEIAELDDALDHPEICPRDDQDTITADTPALLAVLPDQCCRVLLVTFRLTPELRREAERIIRPGGVIAESRLPQK